MTINVPRVSTANTLKGDCAVLITERSSQTLGFIVHLTAPQASAVAGGSVIKFIEVGLFKPPSAFGSATLSLSAQKETAPTDVTPAIKPKTLKANRYPSRSVITK